jgi:glycerol-1-phosphate dehydrogenase [NAD(P)+]
MALETRRIELAPRALDGIAGLFREQFGEATPLLVADPNTLRAAGIAARERLGYPELLTLDDPALYAETRFAEQVQAWLAEREGVPVAVGSGTINDLVKLAAHRLDRPYMAVATAASVDGYTAFGASITHEGSKQTFSCPAPRAVLADLDVLAAAPPELAAAGYADLLAKVVAGADWILADAVGSEPIDPDAWDDVQGPLRESLADPKGVRSGNQDAIRGLMDGLLASGLAMQRTRTSRPASGAEHQFSHLWDMEHHTHAGKTPAHGFKVGIATVAVAGLYERLLDRPFGPPEVEAGVAAWPTWDEAEAEIAALFPDPEVVRTPLREAAAKWCDARSLRLQLEGLQRIWPELRARLRAQLLPSAELRSRLEAVGAPFLPEQIGISEERLRESFRKAMYLRRRYTVLDLAYRLGILPA